MRSAQKFNRGRIVTQYLEIQLQQRQESKIIPFLLQQRQSTESVAEKNNDARLRALRGHRRHDQQDGDNSRTEQIRSLS